MPDFSTILQSPDIRAIVQQNILERAFHDALFPRLLFRSEASPQVWPANIGDTMVFSAVGLISPKMQPLTPGQDPAPSDYTKEQWTAQLQQYADSIDTHMPSSIVAIANLFLRNAQQLGLSAGQTLNRLVRNKMYNAALSGWTVSSATAAGNATAVAVQRLNGFTKARRPDLTAGSAVKFDTVSGSNPLKVSITLDDGSIQANTVTGFTATTPGDEVGPGTLTLGTAIPGARSVLLRAAIFADDRTSLVRIGGGNKVDNVSSTSLLRLQDIRAAVARFWTENVPEMPDGRFHCHLDPTSQSQVFADPEWQRLLTSLPDYFMYKQFAIGELLGCVYFRNSECPIPETVTGGSTATFSLQDNFAGELFNTGATTGVKVHRPLFVGQGAIYEYYQDMAAMLTEAGVTGKIGEPRITNNGIEVFTERVQLVIRAPLNRLQDTVATSWKFIGDWPVRTDVTSGDVARYKRLQVIEHGE